jgi:hypothetical protein
MTDTSGLAEQQSEAILQAIYDDVDQRLNPNDAESGCSDCARPCVECRLYAGRRAKAIREQVIENGDVDVAIAWLKSIGRWSGKVTREQVQKELDALRARASLSQGEPHGE